MNEHLLDLERAAAKLDQRRATSAMEEKQILDRLWEHYELSHSDAQAQRPDGEPLESLLELVNLFVENVLPRLGEVSCDVNGSHVLRSLLCVLLGCPNDRAAVKKHIVKGALMKKVGVLEGEK